jgi:very-short-patch-repair endonuclease
MRGPDRKTAGKVRRLRRNATDAEMKLWFSVRDRRLGGFKFVRQEPIGPMWWTLFAATGSLLSKWMVGNMLKAQAIRFVMLT